MMLAPTANLPKPLSLCSPFFSLSSSKRQPPISATIIPSSSSSQQKQNLYQPFRPPPSPLPPKFRSLDTESRLDILANRLGLWFEYAPLIPSLVGEGFTPSTIEELTGISGVEQNRLVVAAQVRETLVQSKTDEEILSFFDNGGAELLYEIRLLSSSQRAAAARFLLERRLDGKGAQEVARAMKDFPRRRGEKGWENFDYTLPADCLAFMHYRQALEHNAGSEERMAALKQALEVVGSEAARVRVLQDLEGRESEGKGESEVGEAVRVPVVRMRVGEVAESTTVVMLPVSRGEEGGREVEAAPWECRSKGEFGVVEAERGWSRWVVLPGWEPVAGLQKGGVAVEFPDARVLPWRVNRWYKEEPVLVVADRGRSEVAADDGFYLVGDGGGGGLKVLRGVALKEMGMEGCLGMVVLVVRPPREDTDDQLADEDWE